MLSEVKHYSKRLLWSREAWRGMGFPLFAGYLGSSFIFHPSREHISSPNKRLKRPLSHWPRVALLPLKTEGCPAIWWTVLNRDGHSSASTSGTGRRLMRLSGSVPVVPSLEKAPTGDCTKFHVRINYARYIEKSGWCQLLSHSFKYILIFWSCLKTLAGHLNPYPGLCYCIPWKGTQHCEKHTFLSF